MNIEILWAAHTQGLPLPPHTYDWKTHRLTVSSTTDTLCPIDILAYVVMTSK